MSAPQNANDLLFAGGGAPALQWANTETAQDYPVGTTYAGEITKTSAVAQRDLQDKSKISRWPDGSIKYVALLTLRTDLRDPRFEEDDGLRTLWVSGKYLTNAVKDAVKATGAREIEEGGWMSVKLSGYGKPQQGFRPPRLFEVTYRRPTPEKRAEIAARKQAEQDAWNGAGPAADASDPWGVPQNSFPQPPAADPWSQPPAEPVRGGFADSPKLGPDGTATAGMTPEARALVDQMYRQQQGGTQ